MLTHALSSRFNTGSLPDRRLCLLTTLAWLGALVLTSLYGLWILGLLAILTAAAFLAGAVASTIVSPGRWLVRMDAAAAGAMLYTALVLMVPHVVTEHAGSGITGLLLGFAAAVLLHQSSTRGGSGQTTLAALTLHSLFDGVLLGTLYTLMPPFGLSVGIALLAHKAPAGYALARRLVHAGRSTILVVLPALATGLGAVSIAIIRPLYLPAGLLFGAATGLLLFVTLVFWFSNAARQRHDPGGWIAFGTGTLIIAAVAWLAPHGI